MIKTINFITWPLVHVINLFQYMHARALYEIVVTTLYIVQYYSIDQFNFNIIWNAIIFRVLKPN